jgi:hypothetical protein
MGVSRDRARQYLRRPADQLLPDELSVFTNAMNNLLGYPHGRDDLLLPLVKADKGEIRSALQRLLARDKK